MSITHILDTAVPRQPPFAKPPKAPPKKRSRTPVPKKSRGHAVSTPNNATERSGVPARRTPEQVLRAEPELDEDEAYARKLAKRSHAPNTELAYRTDLKHWEQYARSKGFASPYFPIEVNQLRKYIAAMGRDGLSVSTIRRRCAAIARLHKSEGVESPTKSMRVTEVIQGIARERKQQPKKKRALTADVVLKIVKHPDSRLRDRAIFLFAIYAAMRRSELVALRWGDLVFGTDGISVAIRSSKTDQEGEGAAIGILPFPDDPTLCPVRTLQRWRKARRDPDLSERVFPISVSMLVKDLKRCVALVGEDAREYGGHSFRSGFSTNAAAANVPIELWTKHTRHLSRDVASGYAQVHDALRNPALEAMRDSFRRARARQDAER